MLPFGLQKSTVDVLFLQSFNFVLLVIEFSLYREQMFTIFLSTSPLLYGKMVYSKEEERN